MSIRRFEFQTLLLLVAFLTARGFHRHARVSSRSIKVWKPAFSAVSPVTDPLTEEKIENTQPSVVDESMEPDQMQQALWYGWWKKLEAKIGTVDESRLIFPEYDSREVPHLFSSLRYNADTTQVERASSSVLRAAALISMSALGPGLLAFPAATTEIGFAPSAIAFLPAYMYMTISGLLLAELQLNRMVRTGKVQHHILQLMEELGAPSQALAAASFFFVEYALLLYLLVQGSNLFSGLETAPLISVAGCLGLVSWLLPEEPQGKIVMPALFATTLGSFAVTAATGLAHNDWSLLITNQHPEHVIDCFSILFMSLVFQSVIPTVVTQLEGDRTKIQQAVVLGTTVPLLMLLIWNALLQGHGIAALTEATPVFVATAWLGAALSKTRSLANAMDQVVLPPHKEIPSRNSSAEGLTVRKAAVLAFALAPPALIAMSPSESTTALEFAGAFGASTLFLVLTPIMAWKERYTSQEVVVTKPIVPFGKLPLGSMWKAAATLIVEQGAEKLGVFKYFQEHIISSVI